MSYYYYFCTNPRQMYKLDYEVNLNLNPNFTQMTPEQSAFWEEHPEATMNEVRNCQINPPYVPPVIPIEELRENTLKQIDTLSRGTLGVFVDTLEFANASASTIYAKGKDIDPIYDDEKTLKTASKFLVKGSLCRNLYLELKEQVMEAETEEELNAIYESAVNSYAEIAQDEETLESVRRDKLEEIELYDTSSNVNSFYLNGNPMWLDKETRISLMNSLSMCEAAGRTTMDMWFGNVCYNLNIDTAKNLLSSIELYAMECYNVTAQHKQTVKSLETIEEIENFEVSTSYPQKLYLNL